MQATGTGAATAPATQVPGAAGSEVGRWRLVGLLGSVLVALGALGAGVLPQPNTWSTAPVLGALQSPVGSAISTAVAALGMLTLVVAWLRLGQVVAHCTVRALTVTAGCWAAPLALAPPILSRDVYAYAAAGDLVQHGMNPYDHGPADLPSRFLSSTSTSWYHVPFAYGPFFLLLCGLVTTIAAGHLVVALVLLRLLAIAGVLGLAWGIPRLAAACGVDPRRAVWLGVANPLLLAHLVGGAHADSLMVGLIVVGLALAAGRHPVWGTVALTLAVAVKATAGLALPFLVLVWAAYRTGPHLARLAGAVWRGVLVFAVLFAAISVGSGLGFGWISSVSTIGKTEQWTSVSTGVGLAVGHVLGLLGLGGADAALAATRDLGLLAFAVLAVVLWIRSARRDDVADSLQAAGWTLLGFVLLGPVVHPWYLTWGLAVLAGTVAAGSLRSRVLVWGSAVLCFLVLPDGYNLARATALPGEILDVLIVLALLVWAVRRRAAGRLPV